MSSRVLDDCMDDNSIEKELICNLYKEDSLWLDKYATDLIQRMENSLEDD